MNHEPVKTSIWSILASLAPALSLSHAFAQDTASGLSAFIAHVCHGATTSGTTLAVTHNVNSYLRN